MKPTNSVSTGILLYVCHIVDDWAEQKYLEGLGRREVYDYGKPLPTERVVLSSVWGVFVTLLASRVVWQVSVKKEFWNVEVCIQ
jgi:hypothetical protein